MTVPENTASGGDAPVRVAPRIAVRHVQLMRAILAAVAAAMITFSSDHSAAFGLAVFSGFAITTALVLGFAAWMAYPAGRRWAAASLAFFSLVAGMAGGVPPWRTTAMFFVIVIAWAALAGLIELAAGWNDRAAMKREGVVDAQRRSEARDATTLGILGLLLAAGTAIVPAGYRLDFFIDDADRWFSLTGIAIAVGVFGAYAAIVAVYLGIAAFSPRREAPAAPRREAATEADASTTEVSS